MNLKEELKNQLETIDTFPNLCGIPDYIMAAVWSNLLILEELKQLNANYIKWK